MPSNYRTIYLEVDLKKNPSILSSKRFVDGSKLKTEVQATIEEFEHNGFDLHTMQTITGPVKISMETREVTVGLLLVFKRQK